MKAPTWIAAAIAVAACASADAGQIWTDMNGDGLPDPGPIPAAPSTNVTAGVWIDAQSFTWTNFLAYVEWGSCASYVSASYVISGGSNFPIDNFSHPRGLGFGGSGYSRGGVDYIGNVTLHLDAPVGCCVSPIIDVYNPYYVFSSLGNAPAGTYMLFTTNPGSCFGDGGGCGGPCGACCFPDGSCQEIGQGACQGSGGVWQGDFTTCASVNCGGGPPTEACCFCDGSCQEALVGQCPPNSVPQGAGTTCVPNTCSPPPVACCFPDGSCIDWSACEPCPEGGVPQAGPCASIACPPPPVAGACCLPTGGCVEMTELACNDANGTWFGPGSSCAPYPCDGLAVEPKSWGRIKGLYR